MEEAASFKIIQIAVRTNIDTRTAENLQRNTRLMVCFGWTEWLAGRTGWAQKGESLPGMLNKCLNRVLSTFRHSFYHFWMEFWVHRSNLPDPGECVHNKNNRPSSAITISIHRNIWLFGRKKTHTFFGFLCFNFFFYCKMNIYCCGIIIVLYIKFDRFVNGRRGGCAFRQRGSISIHPSSDFSWKAQTDGYAGSLFLQMIISIIFYFLFFI